MKVLAINGSPRKGGNTELLLQEAIRGVLDGGGEVMKVALREKKITPCLEIYACRREGSCAIHDDMDELYEAMDEIHRMIFASPIFFYNVPATAKAFIDRCQARWVRRYVLGRSLHSEIRRVGSFIAVGATTGKRLFDGVKLTVKYFFDALEMEYGDELLIRGVDEKGAILRHPRYLGRAYELGRRIVEP